MNHNPSRGERVKAISGACKGHRGTVEHVGVGAHAGEVLVAFEKLPRQWVPVTDIEPIVQLRIPPANDAAASSYRSGGRSGRLGRKG